MNHNDGKYLLAGQRLKVFSTSLVGGTLKWVVEKRVL